MTDFACLTEELDDEEAKNKPVTKISGFLFSTLIAGRSMCRLTGTNRATSPVTRDATYKELELDLNGESGSPDKMLQSTTSFFFNPTHECVSDTAEVLESNYPEPIRERNSIDPTRPPEYGFLTVREGTELRLEGSANPGNNTYRALYNHVAMADSMDVVVPGYGICRLTLKADDRMGQFVQDAPNHQPERSRRLRELSLAISGMGSEILVRDLLGLIGRGLRELRLNFWGDYGPTLKLADVAAVCPELEELQLIGFDTSAVPTQALCDWGLKQLSIGKSNFLNGLPECLEDPDCRMSRELLKINDCYGYRVSAAIEALKALDKEPLSLVKEMFPLPSKTVMISAVMSGDAVNGQPKALHRLDSVLLGLNFRFAATPKQRTVEVRGTWTLDLAMPEDIVVNEGLEALATSLQSERKWRNVQTVLPESFGLVARVLEDQARLIHKLQLRIDNLERAQATAVSSDLAMALEERVRVDAKRRTARLRKELSVGLEQQQTALQSAKEEFTAKTQHQEEVNTKKCLLVEQSLEQLRCKTEERMAQLTDSMQDQLKSLELQFKSSHIQDTETFAKLRQDMAQKVESLECKLMESERIREAAAAVPVVKEVALSPELQEREEDAIREDLARISQDVEEMEARMQKEIAGCRQELLLAIGKKLCKSDITKLLTRKMDASTPVSCV
ncbi:hypothetical protein PHYSODRAFT_308116 [Phytophthora sojae]|uniref:Uncharacterized protein n=1 Tax=Phytophthora sojae (strain P6497) TaxID=1094619 RepID=G5AIA2_PHYSP|nr:hypothetical protein PHYSODRAFT_308116 [Phytophthora sojae]EGZ04704.1 hypothetical protein PHYSODRAFT_308116 [Phytophthora sojae]|eukprot:XP_009539803.1 hypothetical protein PHYSODRAFT_308116 [Phytophthora sojae]